MDRVQTAVIEAAILDQADRGIDDRDQRLIAGGAVGAAAGAQLFDLVRPVAALAAARHRDRAQQPAADIGVERVALDAEPLGRLMCGQIG
jgi:hypothetical protein